MAEHLNEVFAPLEFPPEVAQRVLTHLSHKDAVQGHNARFAFMGRRVLETYLQLFLHSTPGLQATSSPDYDFDNITARTLNTYVLGEHVAPQWRLPDIMRWRPVANDGLKTNDMRSIGLYKVSGTMVESVMGGLFHQFGGSVTHRVFHTRVLPHILLPNRPEGLHSAFHDHAKDVCRNMGGPEGPLVLLGGAAERPSILEK
ncbi:uncharacterized protein STEHIDRAFT_151216 [Stereum hirsutum FP-91666 SS1]|uniref:uncharacterized protein n=1 Tax=Stereum hirsutum (strain FP-91666) TaxID=721885 RepID=UPI000440F4BA|nr:uncharacterized protein STEHIDRAFT_151216 [Stereum hirsutum FP-91666 SS1]EIM91859.1 hypothetical protein STEHIDRAFT_151216 [Stereum hirsutum FP-91666 SS1]